MATTCGFGQIPDGRFKTICCNGRLILDKNCGMSVSSSFIDNVLTVDIGGNVNFATTTIDMKNTTIDFTGSAITGLTANITGNITSDNLIVNTVFANIYRGTKYIGGTFCGDLDSNIACIQELQVAEIREKVVGEGTMFANTVTFIEDLTGNFEGLFTGTLCGEAQVNLIREKVDNAGIGVIGNLIGIFLGTFCGPVTTDTINEKTNGFGIDVTGELRVDDIIANDITADTITSNFCGDLSTGNIRGKNGETITVHTDTEFIANVSIFTLDIETITGIQNIIQDIPFNDLNILSEGSVTITGDRGDIILSPNSDSSVIVTGNVEADNFIGNVCADTIQVDTITDKTGGNIKFTSDVMMGNLIVNNIVGDDILVANLIVTDLFAPGLGVTVVANIFLGNLCGNIQTTKIEGKNGGDITVCTNTNFTENVDFDKDVNVEGNVIIEGSLTVFGARIFGNNVEISGNLIVDGTLFGDMCGNLSSDLITNKSGGDILIDSTTTTSGNANFSANVNVTENINVGGTVTATVLCGDLQTDSISSKSGGNITINDDIDVVGTIFADTLIVPLAVLDVIDPPDSGNVTVNGNVVADKFFGDLCGNVIGDSTCDFTGNFFGGNFCGDIIVGNVYPKQLDGNIDVFGDLVVSGTVFGDIRSDCIENTSLTLDRIVYVGAGGKLVDDAGMTYDDSTDTICTSIYKSTSLTSSRVVFVDGASNLVDDSTFTFTAATDLLTVPKLLLTNPTIDLTISGGTATRVLFFAAGGAVTDDASLTYASGTGTLSTTTFKSTSLAATSVVFVDGSMNLIDDAAFTFASGTGTLSSTIFNSSSLTSGRIIFSDGSSNLVDDGDLTFDGDTLFSTNFCGNVLTGNITEKVVGDGITINGNTTFNDPMRVDLIVPSTPSGNVNVDGNVVANKFFGDFCGDFTGDMCGNLTTENITEKDANGGISINGNTTFNDAVSILGNLTVMGNVVTLNTQTLIVEDNKITLNDGEMGSEVTAGAAGIIIDRGSGNVYQICFDEVRDCLAIGFGNVVADLQCVAEREDIPISAGVPFWDVTDLRFETDVGFTYSPTTDTLTVETVCANTEVQTSNITEKVAGEGISVNGNTIFDQNVTITQNLDVDGNLNVDGTTTLGNQLTVNANVDINGNVDVSNKLTTNELCVTDLEVDGNLNVDGTTTLGNQLTVNANVDINGNVDVSNKLTTNELCVTDLEVDGNLNVDGTTTLGNQLTVNANVDINGNVDVSNKLTTNELCVTDLEVDGNLNVDGTTTLGNQLTVNANVDINGNVDVSNKLTTNELCVTDLEVDGNLNVDGTTTLGNQLTVNANVDINGNVDVSNKLTVGELCVTNDITATNFLGNLCGNANLSAIFAKEPDGNIDVFGNIVLNSALYGDIVSPFIRATSLMEGQIVIVGVDGELSDDATLSFSGGTLTSNVLCGNIQTSNITEKVAGEGISLTGNLITVNGNSTINGALDVNGNLTANDFTVDTLNATTINADLCGNLTTNLITNKVGGNLNIDVGTDLLIVSGNAVFENISTTIANLLTETIESINTTITINSDTNITGNLTVSNDLDVTGNTTATNFLGNLCGNATLSAIFAKESDGNIDVFGNLVLHSAFFGDLVTSSIRDTSLVEGRIVVAGVDGQLIDDASFSFSSGKLTSDSFCGNITTGNITEKVVGAGLDITGNTVFVDNVTIQSNLDVDANLNVDGTTTLNNVIIDNVLTVNANVDINANVDVSNKLTTKDLRVINDVTINSDLDVDANLNVDGLTTLQSILTVNANVDINGNVDVLDKLTTKDLRVINDVTINSDLDVDANLNVDGLTTLQSILTVNANVDINGNVDVLDKLTTKDLRVTNDVTINSDLDVDANLNVDGLTTLQSILTVNANVDINANVDVSNKLTVADLLATNSISDSTLTTGRVVVVGTGGELTDDSAFTFTTGTGTTSSTVFNTTTEYQVSGTRVVGAQESTVANVMAATANTISGIIGTANGVLVTIGNTAMTDESGNINDNFTEIQGNVNNLIIDVDDIRSQFNALLIRLKNHGLLA